MSEFKVGDRVTDSCTGDLGTLVSVEDDGSCGVLWDLGWDAEDLDTLTLVERPNSSLLDEVQDLINILIATGNDNKRLLSRKVAHLLTGSKGRLSRGDKLQAAAMLLVSAGLASEAVPEEDDG